MGQLRRPRGAEKQKTEQFLLMADFSCLISAVLTAAVAASTIAFWCHVRNFVCAAEIVIKHRAKHSLTGGTQAHTHKVADVCNLN